MIITSLYYRLVLVLLPLDCVVSLADQQAEPITYILKSYADAFTTTISTPTQRIESSNDVYDHYVPASELKVEDHEEPPDHVIPYSEHENPPEPATRPNYTGPGVWARPGRDKNVSLDFVPTKLYAQVRGTHTVKHVPREEAIKSAETDEEKENAARLKEVVKITKANTVYSEEGYEDAAYDHAGQIRDADFHEGFAKKLNENIDFKKNVKGRGRRPRKRKGKRNRRSRKGKSRDLNHYGNDYRDQDENEARVSRQQVEPEVLKSALNQSSIIPKSVALEGIRELENDLKRESEEIQKTSTEPYSSTSTASSISRSDYDTTFSATFSTRGYDTTTAKRDVFTVRPKKPTTPWPNLLSRKVRKPARYYGAAKDNSNYNSITADKPTTESYEELLRQYVLNNPNLAPAVTSTSSNPLAFATVNGHGPYLVVVTSPANLMSSSSYEPLTSEATSHYFTVAPKNRTNYKYDSVIESKNRKVQIFGDTTTRYHHDEEDDDEDEEREQRPRGNFEFSKLDANKKPEKVKGDENDEQEEEQDDDDDFTFMQPPKPPDPLFTEPDYPRRPAAQWTDELVESAYSVVEDDVEGPAVGRRPPQKISPLLPIVTRLLPPSPLSASEYTSFQMRDKKSDILPPTVMAIIEAIHHKESKPAFPFLFRKKRSALGHTREWEIEQRDKKLREAESSRRGDSSSGDEARTSKRPSDFDHLLNESPRVALDVVDKEIRDRFKDNSKETSGEASTYASNSKETLDDENHKNEEKVKVEVGLPELDFSSTFDGDEEESDHTTVKPTVDREKYPFYKNDAVLSTAVEYVINPSLVPRKTFGGSEFYDSRRRECEEIEPNLEKLVPETEELEEKRGPRKSKQRLQGLGDKLDCFKAKYFDENPLDNPLFYEEEVKMPPMPDELDPKKFAARISDLPTEKDEYVVPKGPKQPEQFDAKTRKEKMLRNGPKQYVSRPSTSHPTTYVPRTRKGIGQKNRQPSSHKMSNSGRVIPNETKPNPKPKTKPKTKKPSSQNLPAYQTEVYQDVMGTIMNMEKQHRYPPSKYGYTPSHTRFRERHRGKGSQSHNKRRPFGIDGMVPPPQQVRKNKPLIAKYPYSSEGDAYYDSNESYYPVSRIYKRSISVDSPENPEQLLNQLNDIQKVKSTFRIIFTTPVPKNSTTNNEIIATTTIKPALLTPTIYTEPKNAKSPTSGFNRYDKFNNKTNATPAVDDRRKEPRYNVLRRTNKSANFTNSTSSPESSKLSTKTMTDTTDFGSTFIPVIVKPDERTKNRLLKDSQGVDESQEQKESVGETKKTNNFFKSSKNEKRYSDNPGDLEDEKAATIIDSYRLEPHIEEHKELNDFLKGNPPGYTKAFPEESTSDYEESKPKELLQKEESKVSSSYEKKDQSAEETDSKEDSSKSVEETSRESNNSAEGSSENNDSKEAAQSNRNEKKSSNDSNDEPFERYSDRPYSPPENYEDDGYSDLGPRINKPYFYHPPFEIPEYERKKSADLNTSEETEDHETYVYPWEKDDPHDESKSRETTSAYEYPWEKKERKEKRESSQEKYDNEEPEENSEEATNTRPIYIPLGDKHIRGKKDVTKDEVSPENDTSSKFSSKYKSDIIEIPLGAKDATNSNVDGLKQTTESYLKDSIVSWPTVKSRTTQRSLLDDSRTLSTALDSNHESNSDNKSKNSSTYPSPSSSGRYGKTKPTTSITSSTKVDYRTRLRNNRDFPNRHGNNARFSPVTNLQPTTPMPRRRGRVRGISNDSSSSTTSISTSSSGRRRRPTESTASASTTSSDRRRRPFRVQTRNDNTPTSTARTITQHSRISKQEIITKTTYPDDDEEEDAVPEENSSSRSTTKPMPKTNPIELAKIRRGRKLTNDSQDDKAPKKKKKVEKVVITMEETPDHVYETKEVDRDGVKGKFVTITANNNSDTTNGDEEDLRMQDAEIEEMNRRKSADNSFNNMMRDTEELVDKSSGVEVS